MKPFSLYNLRFASILDLNSHHRIEVSEGESDWDWDLSFKIGTPLSFLCLGKHRQK